MLQWKNRIKVNAKLYYNIPSRPTAECALQLLLESHYFESRRTLRRPVSVGFFGFVVILKMQYYHARIPFSSVRFTAPVNSRSKYILGLFS
jgi:hypothetical protein